MAESAYYVNIVTTATAGTIDHGIVQIWNPSATRVIELVELSCVFQAAAPTASASFVARRSTARGATPSSTVTPTAEHHSRRQAAPDSAFVVDAGAFGTQPTLAAGELYPFWSFPAVVSSGIILPIPRGIEIPVGTGLVFVNGAAVIFAISQWCFIVREL